MTFRKSFQDFKPNHTVTIFAPFFFYFIIFINKKTHPIALTLVLSDSGVPALLSRAARFF